MNENNKVKSFEGIELNAAAIDSTLINGRFSRPDNSIPYHRFDVTQSQNFRYESYSRAVKWGENQIALVAKLLSHFQNQIAKSCEKL